MIDVGRGLLVVGIVAAVMGAAAGVFGAARPRQTKSATVAVTGLLISALALVGSTGVLAQRFAVGDHSLVTVADHSRDALGTIDRVMGLWGGMAGSLLLFTAATAVFAAVGVGLGAGRGGRAEPVEVAAACATIAALAITNRTLADPFATLEIPALDGGGLTPILEHWAMRIHPPLVYAGLASTIVPAAATLAALHHRRLDAEWWRHVHAWMLASWGMLAAGMLLGAHWAYAELGWGGYWAWDPIENAALLPWLALTVALHVPQGRRPAARAVAVVLPFLLALIGSTLTRSGATTSVHAFAEARDIGRALTVMVLFAVVVTVGLTFGAWRHLRVVSSHDRHSPAADLAATAVVATVLAVVLLGTLYPLARGWFGGDRLAVEGRFFSGTIAPVVLVGLIALVGHGRRPPAWSAGVAGGAGAVLVVAGWREPFAVVLAAAAVTALVASSRRFATGRRGADLAHVGIALLLLGVAGTATGTQRAVTVAPGEAISVGGHEVVLDAVTIEPGPTRTSTAVVAAITIDGEARRPSLVSYPDRGVLLAESTLRSTPAADIQVILRNADDDLALLIVNVSPLQQLVWWGGLLVVAGGLLAGWQAGGQSSSGRSRRARWDSSSEPNVDFGGASAAGAPDGSLSDGGPGTAEPSAPVVGGPEPV